MIVETDILKKVEDHVLGYYQRTDADTKQYVYHSLEHTNEVVEAAEIIGKELELDEESMEVVLVAAWFHDTGYYEDHENHETRSLQKATDLLNELGARHEFTERVGGCIKATRMPQSPQNIEEKVLCDADLFHLSTDKYFEKCRLMRQEFEAVWGKSHSEPQWIKENIRFFENHNYFTEYARKEFASGKEENYKALKKKAKALKKDKNYVTDLEESLQKLQAKYDKMNEIRPERGRETLFRTTSKNHLDLSGMADNKANIMISINSIILSLVVSILIRKLEESPYLIIPTLILTTVCLVTIVFSILATRPNVTRGKFTRQDIMNKKTNLLFFGNFHGMPISDYEWGMKELLKDGNYIYSSMIRDIYYLGVVLGKKYKMLRISYTIFMFGIVISVLSFVLSIAIVSA